MSSHGWRSASWAKDPKSVGGQGLLMLESADEITHYRVRYEASSLCQCQLCQKEK